MGHFVHSFAEETSATSLNDLQTTSLEWVTNAMSLQQLRKGKCTSTGYPIWMWWILKSCINRVAISPKGFVIAISAM